jgi:diguanylate cyclase (GGDEF)-like protein
MPDTRATAGLPSVLKQLGKMTAIRETYLVEQSLLRTLGPLLGVTETWLYRCDDTNAIVRSLHHVRLIESEQGGVQREAEQLEEIVNGPTVPEEVQDVIENVRILDKPCSRRVDADYVICYPMHGGDEVYGFFVLRRGHEITPMEDAIVRGVLEVFTNFYALLDTSQRDRLTGLLNRYSLELNLDRLWNMLYARMHAPRAESARRDPVPHRYWLGVLDVDHFKQINDTHGHMIGDEVLIVVTRLLQAAFRSTDLLYRYGGEEFIVIIAANDLESATLAFERARKKIEGFRFPRVGHVTISGGFSGADPAVLPQEVINRADKALYESKKAGRNRVFHYETLVRQGVLQEIRTGSVDLF